MCIQKIAFAFAFFGCFDAVQLFMWQRNLNLIYKISKMNGDNDSPINAFDSSNSRGEETPNSATITGKVKPRGGKGRQSFDSWNHFTKYQENGRMRAQCKYCPKNYTCDLNTNGITNMNKHIENQ